jgi:hypothetical protein
VQISSIRLISIQACQASDARASILRYPSSFEVSDHCVSVGVGAEILVLPSLLATSCKEPLPCRRELVTSSLHSTPKATAKQRANMKIRKLAKRQV